MNREEVTLVLTRMFNGVSQELPGHVTAAGSEETGSLMFRLFERDRTGQVSARSLQTALVALSADTLLWKYRSLVSLSGDGSGSITRSGLRSLLQDLSKVDTLETALPSMPMSCSYLTHDRSGPCGSSGGRRVRQRGGSSELVFY
ncbi:hypothetical protein XENORESO_020399 [Xenotaenia resolanae]|uniref:EF-hand domain-containing protein n=1 Tax=Xenotaenia resolanae TaxID=208358 RepID=A0ABV0WHJ6_9TELE